MTSWVWSEWVRDTRLPGRWAQRLDTPVGRRLRRWLSPLQPVGWLLGGVPPSRIGYAPGPLTALRRRRHARLDRPVRLCLLEGPEPGQRFSPVTAYWINERSRAVQAVVDRPERADVVWVHAQDPLSATARQWLEAALARVPPHVPVLNRPEHYDAYHRDDTFRRLRAAGVRVPDPDPRPGDLVVLKGPGQASEKRLQHLTGEPLPPGWRAFAHVDARGPDGLHRRYRAFHLLGVVHAGDVLAARDWQVGLKTYEQHEPTFVLTGPEQEQVRRIGQALGLDWFCVDFLRTSCGEAVFTDINVYPTPVVAEQVDAALGARGRWHVLDTASRTGVPEPQGAFWPRFDEALQALVLRSRLSPATPGPDDEPHGPPGAGQPPGVTSPKRPAVRVPDRDSAAFARVNAVVSGVLASPLARVLPLPLVLLRSTGRRSGRPIPTPVGVHDVGGRTVVFTRAGCKADFRGGAPVEVLRRGRRLRGNATTRDDPALAADLMLQVLAAGRSPRRLGLEVDEGHAPTREELVATGTSVVELDVAPG